MSLAAMRLIILQSVFLLSLPEGQRGLAIQQKKKAYETGNYTMQQIADAFGVHYSTVSRAAP